MSFEISSPFVTSLGHAAWRRIEGVERKDGYCVALPVSYAKRSKQRYPLVIVQHTAGLAGSAIEMCRLMAQTKEIREAILVAADGAPDSSELEKEIRAAHRVDGGNALVLDGRNVAALVTALRSSLGTGHEYGSEVVPLRQRVLMGPLVALSPVIRRVARRPAVAEAPNPHRLYSKVLDRDFEIFVTLPQAPHPRPLSALVVLDANIEFSTVAETAARMAAAGQIPPLAVIGVGTPRVEGPVEFGFRRFEEFSPPPDGYRFDDDLGRIFRSLFAIRGQDGRKRLGRAPDFLRFLSQEMLPQLARELPIDLQDVGILGHSAGGTFVLYALSQTESPFRRYAAVSPGIGVSGSWLVRNAAYATSARRAEKAFLCLGSAEKANAFNVIAGIPETQSYADRLRRAWLDVEFACFQDETHSSVYPRAVEQALAALYRQSAEQMRRKTS